MRFYFVRHGQSEANLLREFSNTGQKHPLTELGVRQAEDLAMRFVKELSDVPPSVNAIRIYSSPLLRATQTAAILSRWLEVGYQTSQALCEYSVGVYEGRSDAAAWQVYRQVQEEWFVHGDIHSRMSGGESLADIQARFLPFVHELLRGPEETTYILISHGGTFFATLPWILKNASLAAIHKLPFPNTGYVLAEKRGEDLICLEWCGKKMVD